LLVSGGINDLRVEVFFVVVIGVEAAVVDSFATA
jgi:hypothetical protein